MPIGPDVLAALRAYRAESVLQGEDDPLWPITYGTFQVFGATQLARACEQAGVKRFTPYGLRRAAVDAMARSGVDAATAARWHRAQLL